MDIQRAKTAAMKYCVERGYSVDVLKGLYFQIISGNLYFVKFPEVKSNGLKNDVETRGIPVLKVTKEYNVAETENTKTVLS